MKHKKVFSGLVAFALVASSYISGCQKPMDEFNNAVGEHIEIYCNSGNSKSLKVTEPNGDFNKYNLDSKFNIVDLDFAIDGESSSLDENYFKSNGFARTMYQFKVDNYLSQCDSVQQVRLNDKK